MTSISITYDSAVRTATADIDKVTARLKNQGAAVSELERQQNRLTAANTRAERASEQLAAAQKNLAAATNEDDVRRFQAEVTKAQVALDREAASAIKASNALQAIENAAREAGVAQNQLSNATQRAAVAKANSSAAAASGTVNVKQLANASLGAAGVNASLAASLGPVGIALGAVAGGALAVGKAYDVANKFAREFATPEQLKRINAVDVAVTGLKGTLANLGAEGDTFTDKVGGMNEGIANLINGFSLLLIQSQLNAGAIDATTASQRIGKVIMGEYATEVDEATDALERFRVKQQNINDAASLPAHARRGSLVGVPGTYNPATGQNVLPFPGATMPNLTQNVTAPVSVTVATTGLGALTRSDGEAIGRVIAPYVLEAMRNAGLAIPGTGASR